LHPPHEAEIERRIVDAELAGRSTIADALAKRLEAMRAQRSAEVVRLDDARARRR
jgi:hypothetical protein